MLNIFRKKIIKSSNYKNEEYQTVTGLFDFGRESLDGRKIQFYITELQKLLKTYPETIVFHNFLDLNFQANFNKAKFIYLEISSLPLFLNYSEIASVIKIIDNKFDSKDLVHRVPEYGIIINSKLYLLEKASWQSEAEFLIWIDAGIARFFNDDEMHRFRINLQFIGPAVDGIFQIDIINWLRQFNFTLPPSNWIKINSSTRIISGGTFIVRRSKLASLAFEFERIVLQNLSRCSWDTEQMFFFFLLKKFRIKFSIQRFSNPVSIFQMLSNQSRRRLTIIDAAIRFFLPKAISKTL